MRGFHAPRGASPAVIDRSADKARLRELARKQAEQAERARLHLTKGGRRRLAELGPLADDSFRLFLDLLGHALTKREDRDGSIDVESADGTLRIVLEPVPGGERVTLATSQGEFHGRDHWITIEPAR